MLRAARFAATLECTIEPRTAARRSSPRSSTYRKVSAERVRDEWIKAMKAKRPSVAFEVMRADGILGITLPEMIDAGRRASRTAITPTTCGGTHGVPRRCEGDPLCGSPGFLHDIGKPRTRAISDKTNDYTFYNHEKRRSRDGRPILERLRFSNEERERIVSLVRNHLVCYSDDWSDAAVRRWIRRVTRERVETFMR